MLVNINVNLVRLRAGVFRPHLGLGKLYPVQGLRRLAVAAVCQGLGIGEDAAQLVDATGLTLDVPGRPEVAAGIIYPNRHGIAGPVPDGRVVRVS
jgi:hypothetical protein